MGKTDTSDQFFISTDVDETMLARAYLRFQDEGSLPTIFSQGVPTLKGFLEMHDQKAVRFLGGFTGPCATLDWAHLAGLGWLSHFQNGRGEVGFGYFQRHWGSEAPLGLTRLMVAYCFGQLGVQALYGTIPEPNGWARQLARTLGFTEVGPLPIFCQWRGVPCAGMIEHLSREVFDGADKRG